MKKNGQIFAIDENGKKVVLDPCPFCGSHFVDKSYDRGTSFSCEVCRYSRGFPGLLQLKKSPVKVPYVDKEGNDIPESEVKYQEYYHQHATLFAIREMNHRN